MNDQRLLERARTAITCILVAVPLLSVAQLISARSWTAVNSTQTVHVGFIALGWLALRGAPPRRRVLLIILAQMALIGLFAVLVGSLRHDTPRTVITVISAMLAASVLMPWGPRWQTAAAVTIAGTVFAGAAISSSLHLTPRDGAMLIAMFIATIFIATVIERQKRALERAQARRKEHEDALAVSEAMFRTIFESAVIGIVRVDLHGTIVEANRSLHRILDYDDGELNGRSLGDIVHPEDRGRDDGVIADLIAGHRESHVADRRYISKRGRQLWGHVTTSAIQSLTGDPIVVAMIDDITARVMAEEQLAEAKASAESAAAAKGRFLAIMSHEIRTPLNAILGFNELLETTDLDEDQTHYVQTVAESGHHLSEIINDVLDFSKIESGAVVLEERSFDPARELRRTVEMFEGAAANKKIELACELDASLPTTLVGDPKRIKQIVANLLSNAIKFTSKGKVVLRARPGTVLERRAELVLEIEDTGVGIDLSASGALFDPFVQADVSTTRKFGGTGLGLAICKQLSELMGGSIQVESDEGKGSLFVVRLPLEIGKGKADGKPARKDRGAMRRKRDTLLGMRVLVVEDDPTNMALIERLLSRVGCDVEGVHNGEEALIALTRQNHPIVLMDIDMPVMDGREATRRIRAQFAADVQPYIIAVTAYASENDRECYLAEGMNDYVSKPIRPHELEDALNRAVHGAPGDASTSPSRGH